MQHISIEDELFCTRFELETISGIVNHNMLERWLPGYCNKNTHQEHISRYNWVKDFVKNKKVLDVACGTGFGTYVMAEIGKAMLVKGFDISEKAVKYASIRNRHSVIEYKLNNAENFHVEDKLDVIVSFETIEHLPNPESFLQCVKKSLHNDGVFFVSTPISEKNIDNNPHNVYHITEWGFKSFHTLLSKFFQIEDIYLQVYNVQPKINNTIVKKVLRKLLGVVKNEPFERIERLTPFKWEEKEIPQANLGVNWQGYQIVKCRQK